MEVKGNSSDKLRADVDVFTLGEEFMFIYTCLCYTGLCQAINIFGIVTNMINIFCFVKQGFQDSVNISLLGLAISDLGSLVTMCGTSVFLTLTVMPVDLPFDTNEVAYITSAMMHFSFTRVSGCLTAVITMERCLCITVPLKIKSIVTPKRTTVVMVCLFIVFFFSGTPVYAVNSLGMKFSPSRNRTLVGLVSTEHREQVEKITFTINNFFIPFTSFVLIVVCTTILSVKLMNTTKWRKKTINSSQVDRVSARNQKTAKMVVMISTLFIVCFVPLCIMMLIIALVPGMSYDGKYVEVSILISGLGYLLESINSSMNILIYHQMSSKYRDAFTHFVCKIA